MASAASPGGADASQSASLSQSQPLSPHAPHDGNEALASDRSTSRRSRNQKKINGFSTYIPQRPVMPISTPVLNTLYGDGITEQKSDDPSTSPTRQWSSKIVALSAGLRRGPVLPVSEGTREYLQARHERRQAEADATIMRNRLNALRAQEERVQRKARAADQRLHQLQLIKKSKVNRKGQRDQIMRELQEQRSAQAQMLRMAEAGRKLAFNQYKEEVLLLKAAQARQYHIEKHEVEQKRKLMVEAIKAQKQEQCKVIRQHEKVFHQRREHQQLYSQAKVEEQRQMRMFLERRKQEEAAAAIRAMAVEEEELLQRLQHAQLEHSSVFQHLASELEGGSSSSSGAHLLHHHHQDQQHQQQLLLTHQQQQQQHPSAQSSIYLHSSSPPSTATVSSSASQQQLLPSAGYKLPPVPATSR